MIELPDDELDKLFRKSSEELDPTYEPKDWNALSKRLDYADGKSPAGWLRKWWPLAIFAFLIPAGLGVYYLMDDFESGKKNISQLSKPRIAESGIAEGDRTINAERGAGSISADLSAGSDETVKNSTPDNKITERDHVRLNNKGEVPESDNEAARETGTEKKQSSKILPRSRSKTGGVYLEPNRSKRKGGDGAFFTAENKLARRKNVSVGSSISENGKEESRQEKNADNVPKFDPGAGQSEKAEVTPYNHNVTVANADESSEKVEDRLLIPVNYLDHLPFRNTRPLIFRQVETPKLAEIPESPEPSREWELSPKIAVRVGYSPDLSTVGLKNFSKPGAAFSLMLEYALTRKLYLQAGVVRSVKEYYANAGEYALKPYVTKINTPYNVDGTCDMIEIPVGFRYDLSQKQRSRWFAGSGFTSYYTQKEKYVYKYRKYVYDQVSGWEGKSGWFWLSHINASVGYEHRISNKLSILAEPYVRIPVKGVGYGKVNLTTTGMWLSFRYTPVFK